MANEAETKICKDCGCEKSLKDFFKASNLCKTCKTKCAIATNAAKRVARPYGMNSGDELICATCQKPFIIKRTIKTIRKVCSLKCNRPTDENVSKGLALMNNLSAEVKAEKARKTSEKLKGRAGRGKSQKGQRNRAAKFYELRGPDMKMYSFKNLAEFVRKNRSLFTDDELKPMGAKTECYASIALRSLFSLNKNGERKLEFWHGWTIGDKSEHSLKRRKKISN